MMYPGVREEPPQDSVKKLIECVIASLDMICPACAASTDGPTWTLLHRRNRPDGEPHPCQRPK